MISFPKSLKRAAAGGAAAALLAASAITLSAAPASAHGGMIYPADRVYQCYLDGWAGSIAAGQGGNMMPTNPVCVDALANGSYSFYTWYGNLLPQVAGRHTEQVADGALCGPSKQYAPYNAVSNAWPKTQISAGPLTLRYAAKAPHPGWWYTYITKEGWDSSKPLAWSDLELIDKTLDPPLLQNGGPEGPEYTWTVQVPERTGDHIIYEVWERTDSPEAFYNCSDVTFGGTSNPNPTPTTSTPAPTPTTTTPAPTPTTSTPAPTPTTTTPAPTPTTTSPAPTPTSTDPGSGAPAQCSVKFTNHSWNGGFTSEVSVGNDSMDTLNGWNVQVKWANGEQITQAWNSTATQSGSTTTFTNAAWNGTVAHHGSVNFGFLGNGSPKTPESVTLNGKPCDIY